MITDAVRWAAGVLAEAGVASPRTDAELLAAHVLGVPRGRLVLASGMDDRQAARFRELVAARAGRVPVQHLLGRAPFRRLELAVGPGVFVPRPETELLAGWGIAAAGAGGEPVVVDLCAGSGAIALAVAQEAPHARVYAVERDPRALAWLRRNVAERAAAGDRPVEVVAADVTGPDALPHLAGRVDVVLCNPPYVPAGSPVPPEVSRHDPAPAVFGGPDGLDVIRPVVALAARLLRPGGGFSEDAGSLDASRPRPGVFGVEHDDTHAAAVRELLAGFADVECHPDLAGRPRFTTARRSGPAGDTWQTGSP